jgi:hypothetical protein
MVGGPMFRLLQRLHLTDDALRFFRRRILFVPLIAWLPLLVLAAVEGRLWGPGDGIPFFHDIGVHARLLVVVPLLLLAELVVFQRLKTIVGDFLACRIIPEATRPRFDAAVATAVRWRNSTALEAILVVAVYGVVYFVTWPQFRGVAEPTWGSTPTAGGVVPTPGGLCYLWFSLPIFHFLLLRWYLRIFIWGRFLWQVSRLELSLVPSHPDRLGGLGLLARVPNAFTPLAAAHGAMLAGMIGNRIVNLGMPLVDFKVEIAVMIGFVLLIIFGPLLPFTFVLERARRAGLREFGRLAHRYVRDFDAKWLRGAAPSAEPLIGTADIQSLADLGNSYEVVRDMKIIPITKFGFLVVTLAAVLPMAPLLLSIMPLDELLRKLVGVML